VNRIILYEYRQHIRPWYDSLEPPPSTLTELGQLWIQNWTNTYGHDGATYSPREDLIDSNPASPVYITPANSSPAHSIHSGEPDPTNMKGPFSSTSPPRPLYFNVNQQAWMPRRSYPGMTDFGPFYIPGQSGTPSDPESHKDQSSESGQATTRSTHTPPATTVDQGTNPTPPKRSATARNPSVALTSNRYSPPADSDNDEPPVPAKAARQAQPLTCVTCMQGSPHCQCPRS
jgi:hypothetical protein